MTSKKHHSNLMVAEQFPALEFTRVNVNGVLAASTRGDLRASTRANVK